MENLKHYGFTEADIELLKILKKPLNKETKRVQVQKTINSGTIQQRIKAAVKDRRIEENGWVNLLSFPLDDERTPPEVRKAYLIQESMMLHQMFDKEEYAYEGYLTEPLNIPE